MGLGPEAARFFDPIRSETMPVGQPITRESRVIFSSGERGFAAKDVVDCAFARGEIDPLWKEFLRVAECDRLANERELELDDSALDSAAIAFRYKHDLITAEETERWLEDRGISLAEFSEYFARQYWGRSYSGMLDPPKSSYQKASPEERDLFLVDLILSGSLDRMAERLSYRVAAQAGERCRAPAKSSPWWRGPERLPLHRRERS